MKRLLLSTAAGACAGVLGAISMEILALACAPAIDAILKGGEKHDPSGIGQEAPFSAAIPGEGPTGKVAGKTADLVGKHLDSEHRRAAALIVHLSFGAGVGAMYGAIGNTFSFIGVGAGLPFGLALWVLAAEMGLPASGLTKWPDRSSVAVQAFGLSAHLVFGFVVSQLYGVSIRFRREAT